MDGAGREGGGYADGVSGPEVLAQPRERISVRRIGPADGGRLREVRLAAIADSPGAYATTLAEAAGRPAIRWDEVAEAGAAGSNQGTWFAEISGFDAGMVSAYRTTDDVVTMTSLWAAPGFRGVGVAEALVAEVEAWAVASGGVALRLWMVERNAHARRFYERLGFRVTGQEIPYEPDPRLIECEMRKPLTA